jgi:hypothetical protein
MRVVALLGIAASAGAHHSGAMFDYQREIVLTGVVASYQWTNPHCWIQLQVPSDKGSIEWSIEMGSPSLLFRGGWRPTTLHSGESLTLTIHPMHDGSNGGLFMSASRPDGSPVLESQSAATAPAPPAAR